MGSGHADALKSSAKRAEQLVRQSMSRRFQPICSIMWKKGNIFVRVYPLCNRFGKNTCQSHK